MRSGVEWSIGVRSGVLGVLRKDKSIGFSLRCVDLGDVLVVEAGVEMGLLATTSGSSKVSSS